MPDSALLHEEGATRSAARSTARVVLPAVFAFLVQTPFTVVQAARAGWSPTGILDVVAAVVGPIALLGARRWPGPVVAIAAAAAALALLAGPTAVPGPGGFAGPAGMMLTPPPLALAFAIVFAIVRGARTWALASLAAVWTVLLAVLAFGGAAWHPQRVVAYGLGMLLAFGAGEFARGRRERHQQHRRRLAEQRQTAEQAERVRIARELHDVLAHSLSSINVQAGMGLHLVDSQPERAAEALAAIKATSKHALDDVRGVIGVLRADGAVPLRPEPGIAELEELALPLRADGVTVHFRTSVASPPPAAVQLALYRIAQESLTNVLRHASAVRVDVELEERNGALELTVTDDGAGSASPSPGSGLLGMAERAALLGGTLEAAPLPHGGFRVHAALPVSS